MAVFIFTFGIFLKLITSIYLTISFALIICPLTYSIVDLFSIKVFCYISLFISAIFSISRFLLEYFTFSVYCTILMEVLKVIYFSDFIFLFSNAQFISFYYKSLANNLIVGLLFALGSLNWL